MLWPMGVHELAFGAEAHIRAWEEAQAWEGFYDAKAVAEPAGRRP